MRVSKLVRSDDGPALFSSIRPVVAGQYETAPVLTHRCSDCSINPLADLVELFERAVNPENVQELVDLCIGRSEASGDAPKAGGHERALWKASRRRGSVSVDEIASASATPFYFKGMFDYFFRRDLYGRWMERQPIILSSGSFDETTFGLPESLKECIRFSILQNWYGYSDSLGRVQTRLALADLECAITDDTVRVDQSRVGITLGATAAIASLADLIARGRPKQDLKALCGLPNYPPVVAAVGRFFPIEFVATPLIAGTTRIDSLIEKARGGADFLLLQTVTNPWGTRISDVDIERLLDATPRRCVVVLDCSHDWFGPPTNKVVDDSGLSVTPYRDNVVIVRSLSKRWAAPGIKCGWIVGSAPLIKEFYAHASTTYGGPPSLFFLLLEVFGRFEALYRRGKCADKGTLKNFEANYGINEDSLRNAFDEYRLSASQFATRVFQARQQTCEQLTEARFHVVEPSFSINVFARASSLPDYSVYRRLIREQNVAVFPSTLCMLPCPGGMRISPCVPSSILDDALGRIVRWSKSL